MGTRVGTFAELWKDYAAPRRTLASSKEFPPIPGAADPSSANESNPVHRPSSEAGPSVKCLTKQIHVFVL